MEKIFNLGRKIIPKKIFRLGQPVWHFFLALTGNLIYGFPGRRMVCIGITGTNGKSTTVELVNSILKASGKTTGMISTIAWEMAGARTDNETSRTTLGRWQTPKLLRQMVKDGCEYAVIEVASEGILQFRTWGIPFDVAVFTNLSPEHLNTHKTMTNYRNTKGKLFAGLYNSKRKKGVKKVSVVNADDKEGKYFNSFPADLHLLYGLKKGDVRAKDVKAQDNLEFKITNGKKDILVRSELRGEFNVYNILAAWCVGIGLELPEADIKKGIEAVKLVEGRMQEIPNKKGIKVFVDYAMTPDSYEMLFAEMRKISKGKLIAVFGAAGQRDKAKRPVIGEIAAKMTDHIILTDDEPYNEDPEKIIAEIEAGVKKVKKDGYEIIRDRGKAFERAIKIAKKGDVIVIPGMGHEKWRNVGGNKRIRWDEPKILEEMLKK